MIETSLLNYLKHYALRLLEGKAIENEKEARALVGFLNAMLDQAVKDERDGLKVLGETAHAGDAEKAYLAVEDIIADSGFEAVLDGPDTSDGP